LSSLENEWLNTCFRVTLVFEFVFFPFSDALLFFAPQSSITLLSHWGNSNNTWHFFWSPPRVRYILSTKITEFVTHRNWTVIWIKRKCSLILLPSITFYFSKAVKLVLKTEIMVMWHFVELPSPKCHVLFERPHFSLLRVCWNVLLLPVLWYPNTILQNVYFLTAAAVLGIASTPTPSKIILDCHSNPSPLHIHYYKSKSIFQNGLTILSFVMQQKPRNVITGQCYQPLNDHISRSHLLKINK